MKKMRSFEEYRRNDLTILAVLTLVFEYIIIRVAHSQMFADQAYSVSLAPAMTTIAYMRWGIYGGFIAALSGFAGCVFSGATVSQFMIYIAGNLFSMLSLILLYRAGFEKVRTSQWYMGYPVLVLVLMQSGRALVSVLLGSPAQLAAGFFLTDAVTDLFTLVIIWIAHRLDGLYENQKHYLLRVHEEEAQKKESEDGFYEV